MVTCDHEYDYSEQEVKDLAKKLMRCKHCHRLIFQESYHDDKKWASLLLALMCVFIVSSAFISPNETSYRDLSYSIRVKRYTKGPSNDDG